MNNQQMKQNEQYLYYLSIGYYVVGGITALMACFPVIHLLVGLGLMFAGLTGQMPAEEGFIPVMFGAFFAAFAAVFILSGWGLAYVLVRAGGHLQARQKHTFCIVAAGLACIIMPFGTVLGVLSLILLLQPEVRVLFEPEKEGII